LIGVAVNHHRIVVDDLDPTVGLNGPGICHGVAPELDEVHTLT
jgi:hypothetical protein